MKPHPTGMAGFTLLPVVLAMSLIAAIAFLLNRDNGINAEMAVSQIEADHARYTAEAGLQAINAITQGMNCAGYANLNATPFGADSFTAAVTPASGTPVTLTATGVTAGGASAALARANVVVYQTMPHMLLLQPDPAGGKDAWLNGASSAKFSINEGTNPTLYLSGVDQRPLLKFDVSGIPGGSKITAATLSLYQDRTGTVGSTPANPAYNVHRVTRSWVEGTGYGSATGDGATWNSRDGVAAWTTPGGDFDPAVAASTPAIAAIGWKTWDVTGLVADWADGAYSNHGILLYGVGAITTVGFASSDNATGANRPRLDVSYLPRCGALSATPFAAAADAKIDSASTKSATNYGGSTVIGIKGWTMMSNNEIRLLARFDTSSIAPAATLNSAKLRFYVASITSSAANRTVTAYPLTEPWVEGTKTGTGTSDGVTWNRKNATTNWISAGGSYDPTAPATLTLAGNFAPSWIELDVTAMAQQWVTTPTNNFGVIVRLPNWDGETFNINSSENAANQPQLVITY